MVQVPSERVSVFYSGVGLLGATERSRTGAMKQLMGQLL